MKTYTIPAQVFEEVVLQLEGAREELEELSRRVPWFCSMVPERIDELLEVLVDIKEGDESL